MAATGPGGERRISIQTSVRKDWKKKIKDDVKKVHNELGEDYMIFISSRRVPTAKFESIRAELQEEYGVSVKKYDAQSIASIIDEAGRTHEILEVMNIDIEENYNRSIEGKSFKAQAYSSFTLFGQEPREFREDVIESVIISEIIDASDGIRRDSLERKVKNILEPERASDISGIVDKMIMSGDIEYDEGVIYVSSELKEDTEATDALIDKEMAQLEKNIKGYLKSISQNEVTQERLDIVMENVGTIIMEAARETAYSVDRKIGQSDVDRTSYVEDSIDQINIVLDELGISQQGLRSEAVEAVGDIASSSPAGKRIFAGELYYILTTMETPHLVQALGGGGGIRVWLDTSVVIPMLCGLLYEPIEHRYGIATYDLFERINRHSIPISVPYDYLEEVSYQMLKAYTDYMPIVREFVDPDLKDSDNPFVAYYSSLNEEQELNFKNYIEGIGVPKGVSQMNFKASIRSIVNILRDTLSEYGIDTSKIYPDDKSKINEVKRGLTGIISTYEDYRPDQVIKHDARTIAFLNEKEPKRETNNIYCTWDNVPQIYKRENSTLWEALTPPSLNDMLSLTSPKQRRGNIKKPIEIAKRITSEAHNKGAKIWDILVQIEEDEFHDAELRKMAREFKQDYMQQDEVSTHREDIAEAWSDWKSDYSS